MVRRKRKVGSGKNKLGKKKVVLKELRETPSKMKGLKKSVLASLDKQKGGGGNKKKGRVSTGISGLDEALNGGIPEGHLVLVSGSCGAGKSTLGMQFLREGAQKGEAGVYITFEEAPEKVWANASQFWEVSSLKKKVSVVNPAIYKFGALVKLIEDAIDKENAKRVVIDSVSVLSFYLSDAFDVRKGILELNKKLRKEGATIFALSEVPEGSGALSTNGVEEFVSDGVLVLHMLHEGPSMVRALSVRKMRGTKHSLRLMPLQITESGVEVYPDQEIFAEE